MPVPKYKTSPAKRDRRRSHLALTAPGYALCPNCDSPRMPHRVCPSCGFYSGKQVLKIKATSASAATWDGSSPSSASGSEEGSSS